MDRKADDLTMMTVDESGKPKLAEAWKGGPPTLFRALLFLWERPKERLAGGQG